MKITKVTKTNYEIYKVAKPFLIYNESFRKIQPGFKKCFICKNDFKDGENLNLTFVVARTNELICDGCLADIETNNPEVKIINVKRKEKE